MFFYHVRIALKSLRRNPVLSSLLIGGIAVGIGISTAFVTLRHMYVQDPIPGGSDRVFYVRLDSWGGQQSYMSDDPESLPDQVTYADARALLESPIPRRQTPTFVGAAFLHPATAATRPWQAEIRLTFNDLFDIFRMPFAYGGPWTEDADARAERVAVIDHDTNQKLFGGENSVGRTIRLEDAEFRVVGVLAPWRPPLRYFEMNRGATGKPEEVYLPFNLVEPMQIATRGNANNWKPIQPYSFEAMLASERVWLQYWVELAAPGDVDAYGDWIASYVEGQRSLGRFEQTTRYRLSTVPQLIEEFGLMPAGVRAMSIVALLFLLVCSLNLIGILLGKFLARASEVSVRRALGASRAQVFWQHLIECELIGLIGGGAGLLLSLGVLAVIRRHMRNGEALRLDSEMLLFAAVLSLVAGLIAGLYPAWRACRIAPAMQLKVQ
ncbi:MAG TPA: ABC transporter permease [Thermoanaerobaculia bacterium]